MEWVWIPEKNRINKRDHGLNFETATLVFDDAFAVSRIDPHQDGDRWQTVGFVGSVLLFVIHTWSEESSAVGQTAGRIISARKATAHERKAYENDQF